MRDRRLERRAVHPEQDFPPLLSPAGGWSLCPILFDWSRWLEWVGSPLLLIHLLTSSFWSTCNVSYIMLILCQGNQNISCLNPYFNKLICGRRHNHMPYRCAIKGTLRKGRYYLRLWGSKASWKRGHLNWALKDVLDLQRPGEGGGAKRSDELERSWQSRKAWLCTTGQVVCLRLAVGEKT